MFLLRRAWKACPGKMIPLGCLVYFMPSPTREITDKAGPSLLPGVFQGYRSGPGGLWEGDYIIAPLTMFQGLTLHSKADPATFKDLRPHIPRTVKWTPHGVYFPFFAKYVRQKDTLAGVEESQCYSKRKEQEERGLP